MRVFGFYSNIYFRNIINDVGDLPMSTHDLYHSEEYIEKNPTLHEEDSSWKVSEIIPLVDTLLADETISSGEINVLDVGGGAGLILSQLSAYIQDRHNVKVRKFALDLSLGMLRVQRKNNPDLRASLNGDVRRICFSEKRIELALMIDVLEHVPNPTLALQELKRVAKYAAFKVPLEDNLASKMWNILSQGRSRSSQVENFGHVNLYSFHTLTRDISAYLGQIRSFFFADEFQYSLFLKKGQKTSLEKVRNVLGYCLFRFSPLLCSFVLGGYLMVLVKCY
jgi:ubiquinone/menaquinone biosynthesis C-methylase UbiE